MYEFNGQLAGMTLDFGAAKNALRHSPLLHDARMFLRCCNVPETATRILCSSIHSYLSRAAVLAQLHYLSATLSSPSCRWASFIAPVNYSRILPTILVFKAIPRLSRPQNVIIPRHLTHLHEVLASPPAWHSLPLAHGLRTRSPATRGHESARGTRRKVMYLLLP